MSFVERLGRHSAIYTIAMALQRGAAFVLVPFYTRVLDPAEYGTIAIITALSGVLAVLLPMLLHASVTRFYFDFRDQPELLRRFMGTILLGTFVSCCALVGLAVFAGRSVFDWLLVDVPFFPYVVLGIATAAAQPFFQLVLSFLQVREQPIRYSLISLGHFLVMLALTLGLILGAGYGAAGALVAMLISTLLFATIGLLALRRYFELCLRLELLKPAVKYVLPQIPHALAAQLLVASDRFLLNRSVSLAAVGVYNIAVLFSLIVDMLAQSINRAYVPMAMEALQSRNPGQLAQLKDAGKTVVVALCIISSLLTIFSDEIIKIAVGQDFETASTYVPFLAFAGAAGGIYVVFSNILFFDRAATKYLPLITVSTSAIGIGLNFVLIEAYGAIGAAAAMLLAQVLTTVVVAVIARRFEPLVWEYSTFAALYLIALSASAGLALFPPLEGLANLTLRAASWILLCCVLSFVAWRKPFRIIALAAKVAKPRRSN